nr:MAG TPA: hypothetical protein [Caudoviricetes sp.]
MLQQCSYRCDQQDHTAYAIILTVAYVVGLGMG